MCAKRERECVWKKERMQAHICIKSMKTFPNKNPHTFIPSACLMYLLYIEKSVKTAIFGFLRGLFSEPIPYRYGHI